VFLGDVRDQSLAKALSAIVVCNSEKENVSVAADGREADQFVSVGFDVEIHRRALVGAREETAALSEHTPGVSDLLFESPGLVEIVIVTWLYHPSLDVDTHYLRIYVASILIPPSAPPTGFRGESDAIP
jgi:hypothetical protein